jgi:hypothetical protein
MDGQFLGGKSRQGDIGIDGLSRDCDQRLQKRPIGADTSDKSDSHA